MPRSNLYPCRSSDTPRINQFSTYFPAKSSSINPFRYRIQQVNMAPKASTSGGSKTKKAAGLAQVSRLFSSRSNQKKPKRPNSTVARSLTPWSPLLIICSSHTSYLLGRSAACQGSMLTHSPHLHSEAANPPSPHPPKRSPPPLPANPPFANPSRPTMSGETKRRQRKIRCWSRQTRMRRS